MGLAVGLDLTKDRVEDTMTEKKTGTREWAKHNLNIARGCSNGCLYCYARANALRFRQIDSTEGWKEMKVFKAKVEKGYGKRKNDDPDVYDIMFPTAHDITPDILGECVIVLRKVLEAGNTVLIVSKPSLVCIEGMVWELKEWKDQVVWRFTIGSDDDDILSFWEPNAPPFQERLDALKHCYENGWTTSVSIEPMLDPVNIDRLVEALLPSVSETIWIGKANRIRHRCPDVASGVLDELEEAYADEEILAIVERWDDNPKIRWKDSIKEVIKAHAEAQD